MYDDSPQPAIALDVELLVEEIKKRSVLWDRYVTEYNDRFRKFQMWEEVHQAVFDDWSELGSAEKRVRAEEIKKKWRNLRDTYAKELANQKMAQKGKIKRKRPHRLAKQLSFLKRIFKEKEDESSETSDEESEGQKKSKHCCNNIVIDVETLIREVKSRPILWNKQTLPGERGERDLRNRHWEEICSVVFEDWSELSKTAKSLRSVEVKKKWRNLRDTFCRELSSIRQVELGTRRPKRPYRHFEELAFLQGHLGKQYDEDYVVMDSQQTTLEIEAASSSYSLSEPEDAPAAPAASQPVQVRTYDEDVCFAEMLVPMLKKLNDDQKHYAQVKILNVLRRARQFDPLGNISVDKSHAVVVVKNEHSSP